MVLHPCEMRSTVWKVERPEEVVPLYVREGAEEETKEEREEIGRERGAENDEEQRNEEEAVG